MTAQTRTSHLEHQICVSGESIRTINSQEIRETAELLHRIVRDIKILGAIPLNVSNPDKEID